MKEIRIEHLDELLQEYKKDKASTIARHALSKGEINQVCNSNDDKFDVEFNFNVNVKTMSATNQRASGRCWIFAACNVLREQIAKTCNIKEFELSQSYIAFYDKLEKLNYVCNALIDLKDADYDDRTVQFILSNPIGDGGQWDMFVNIVNKYGICPKNVYDETATSSATRTLNQLLNCELRHFSAKLHEVNSISLEEAYALKKTFMDRFYVALVNCYGIPPKTFEFEYTNANNQVVVEKGYTPTSYFNKYVGTFLNEYVSIINAPTGDKPFNKIYNVKYLGNVSEGKEVTHLNLSIERMKELIIAQLKDNEVVWFGCDVSFYGDRNLGIWDDNMFDYISALNLDFKVNKGSALDFRCSAMNHAMCISGVHLEENIAKKWKIENSWGNKNGVLGYYIMSSTWFDRYTYQAVINKKYLSSEEIKILSSKPILLKPWDPMGSLAK